MGYTHYWNTQKAFTPKQWKAICKDFSKMVSAHGELIESDSFGEIITPDYICFNGIGEKAHETMLLNRQPTAFSLCKTVKKPYDSMVCALLLIASYHNKSFRFSSDGWDKEAGIVDEEWIFAYNQLKATIPEIDALLMNKMLYRMRKQV